MTTALAPYHLPHAIENTILGSIGGALGVAARVGGATGHLLAHVARSAFISGADLGLLIAAAVVLAGCVLALLTLPARPRAAADRNQRIRVAHRSARRLCYLRDGQLAAACSSPRLRPAEVNSC